MAYLQRSCSSCYCDVYCGVSVSFGKGKLYLVGVFLVRGRVFVKLCMATLVEVD